MAGRQRRVEHRGGLVEVVGEGAGDAVRAGHGLEHDEALVEGAVDEVVPTRVEAVEEERDEPRGDDRFVGAETAHGVLEGVGSLGLGHPDGLAVEHHRLHRQAADHRHDFWHS